jgi:hypothetical protein
MRRDDDELPEDRWHFRLHVLGLTVAAVLLAAFFLLYGGKLLGFLNALFGNNYGPYY